MEGDERPFRRHRPKADKVELVSVATNLLLLEQTMSVKIQVTQKHITQGVPTSPDTCPIALAAFDAGLRLAGGYLLVTSKVIYTDKGKYLLPDEACQFVRQFDDEKTVQPFEFTTNKI
jgi:hypothetical protein